MSAPSEEELRRPFIYRYFCQIPETGKFTEEDWRNREKWDAYEGAVGEMLTKTSTTYDHGISWNLWIKNMPVSRH